MRIRPTTGGASYVVETGTEDLPLNELIGQSLALRYEGRIECVACGRVTAKSWSQGYCWPCAQRLPQCDLCHVSPDRCHFEAGTCRDPAWARDHCHQEHIVYLANTAGLKVGITRATQIPTRWLDQGAVQALPILRTRTRQQAGLIEAALRAHVADRTDWRRLLRGDSEPLDLARERDRLLKLGAEEIGRLRERFGAEEISAAEGCAGFHCSYPVVAYPEKTTPLTLDRTPVIEGRLQGIKGQYLIFQGGVFNMRKHTGYRVRMSW